MASVGGVREEHRAQVLGQLRVNGPMPRVALASELHLSMQTISEIIAALESEGVVVRAGEGESSGGRRPILYGLRMDGLLAAGVHVGRERISAVISDLSGKVRAEASQACDLSDGQERFVTVLVKVLDRLLAKWDRHQIVGIGVGLPTRLSDSEKGVFRPSGTSGWEGVDLPELLGGRYELPVVAENRAHAIAVGEYLFGAGRGVLDQLCLVLDQGIGGAVISGGRLFSGGDGGGGALGRMALDLSGSGGSQRVSDVVATTAIVRSAKTRLREQKRRTLGGVPVGQIEVAEVIDQALAGDQPMAEVLAEVGRCLGAVASATLCVTDSQLVLLCGSTLRAGDLIVGPFRQAMADLLPFAEPEVRMGHLGSRGGSLGAAALVLTGMVGAVPGVASDQLATPPSTHRRGNADV